jgi:hypothetical protein
MTQLDKLFARLLANPRQSIAFREFERLIEVMRVANASGKH